MKKTHFFLLVSFLIFVLVLISCIGLILLLSPHRRATAKESSEPFCVVIDCGHGGPDGGAVGADGTAEKDINLALGFALKALLEQNGYSVVMTRKDDNFICDDHSASLREQNVSDHHNRLAVAEKYKNSVFVSLHMNKFSDARYWGAQLFYSPNHADSKVLSALIRERIIAFVQQGNSRELKEMDSSVYIIYHATHPALLLECGFMSNREELEKFKTEKYRSKFAFSVFLGINDYVMQRGKNG